jgi:hypothetical protein
MQLAYTTIKCKSSKDIEKKNLIGFDNIKFEFKVW